VPLSGQTGVETAFLCFAKRVLGVCNHAGAELQTPKRVWQNIKMRFRPRCADLSVGWVPPFRHPLPMPLTPPSPPPAAVPRDGNNDTLGSPAPENQHRRPGRAAPERKRREGCGRQHPMQVAAAALFWGAEAPLNKAGGLGAAPPQGGGGVISHRPVSRPGRPLFYLCLIKTSFMLVLGPPSQGGSQGRVRTSMFFKRSGAWARLRPGSRG
jgi:hypothetical protein